MDYLGQPLKRFEDARLLTGNGLFIDDIKLPDMLYAVVVRSIHAHARILSIDTSDAISLAGIVEVLTGQDLVGVPEAIKGRFQALVAMKNSRRN